MSNFHAPGDNSSECILRVRSTACFQPLSCDYPSDWNVLLAENLLAEWAVFVRKVEEDVKSPPVQKLYAWLTSLLSVGRGRRVSEVSAGNCQSTQHSLALVANSQWSTKLARSHTIIRSRSAKMLGCAYASFRLHQYIFKCAALSLYIEWSRVLLLNLGSRTGLPG